VEHIVMEAWPFHSLTTVPTSFSPWSRDKSSSAYTHVMMLGGLRRLPRTDKRKFANVWSRLVA
jgi:hypothetical protein